MGNNAPAPIKGNFDMKIQIIGENLTKFTESISKVEKQTLIKKFWEFNYNKNIDVKKQIDEYFEYLQKEKNKKDKTINLKECLLVRIKNISDKEVTTIIEKMNKLAQPQYMPFVLLLLENNYTENIKPHIDSQKYKRVDPRFFSVEEFKDNDPTIIPNILERLLRFCSIYNELGEYFTIGEGDNAQNYDLIYNYFPFNLNIACIGRFGQGKSTGVNAILKEYKAKESGKGSSVTKKLTFYQVENQPIRLLDIPGFEDEETVKKAIEKFQECDKKMDKLKDNIHIVLYFISYTDTRGFSKLELPMLEEICKHKSIKVIYVITHSNPNMDSEDKEEKINNLNEGLQNLTENTSCFEQTKDGGILIATLDNTVFLNFYDDKKTSFKAYGKGKLFKKIRDIFKQTDDYKNFEESKSKKDEKYVKQQAEKLRAQAKEVLTANKVWGGVVGIIPGVDWLLQKFVIKKNAVKKLGQIYGIDVKIIDEKEKNKVRLKTKNSKNQSDNDINFTEEGLTEETIKYKVGNSFKVTGEAASYIGGGASVGTGVIKATTIATEAASSTSTAATSIIAGVGSTALKVVGTGMVVVGAVVGVALGGYFTHKYCEELIDKFEKYYIENFGKIKNSYEQVIDYLTKESESNQ